MSATYGIDVESADDPFLSTIVDAANVAAAAFVPGKFLVDIIPIREHLSAQTTPAKN